ncbi:MAG: hypothetical protein HY547_04235 [Elusimicrobia bacterium]|nr:hypothetical protein [Elusimicrobiota bacterium]
MDENNAKLPLENVIQEGLRALKNPRARANIPALLVSIGAPRLRFLGYKPAHTIKNPEQKLYSLLARTNPGRSVHSLYNSWIRRLVSFERALSCAK